MQEQETTTAATTTSLKDRYVALANAIDTRNTQMAISDQKTLDVTLESFVAHIDNCRELSSAGKEEPVVTVLPKEQRELAIDVLTTLYEASLSNKQLRHIGAFQNTVPTKVGKVDIFSIECFEVGKPNATVFNLITDPNMSAKSRQGVTLLTQEQRDTLSEDVRTLVSALEAKGFEAMLLQNTTLVVEKSNTEQGVTIGVFITTVVTQDPLANTKPVFLDILSTVDQAFIAATKTEGEKVSPSTQLWADATNAFMTAAETNITEFTNLNSDGGFLQAKGDENTEAKNPATRIVLQDQEKVIALITATGEFLSDFKVEGTEIITDEAFLEAACELIKETYKGINLPTFLVTRFKDWEYAASAISAYWRDESAELEICLKQITSITEEEYNEHMRQLEEAATAKAEEVSDELSESVEVMPTEVDTTEVDVSDVSVTTEVTQPATPTTDNDEELPF